MGASLNLDPSASFSQSVPYVLIAVIPGTGYYNVCIIGSSIIPIALSSNSIVFY